MKKILPVLFAFLIVLTLPVHAAAGKLSATADASGDKVTITVHLYNPGIVATRIFVRYDSNVLQLIDAQNGDVFPKGNAVFGKELSADPYAMLWDESLRRDNNTTSGTLCTVTFAVKGGTENGKTSVRFAVDKSSTFDVDLNNVEVTECSCSVDVPVVTTKGTGSTAATKPTTVTTAASVPSGMTTTTKAAPPVTTTKPTPTTTKITAASGQTTAPKLPDKIAADLSSAASSAAAAQEKASSAAANVPSTAAQGTTGAQNDATKPNASFTDGSATVCASDETVPDILPADGTLSTATETLTEAQNEPQTTKNHRGFLWFLLLIPAAVAVVLVARKKKA